jgi:hypothetical protein
VSGLLGQPPVLAALAAVILAVLWLAGAGAREARRSLAEREAVTEAWAAALGRRERALLERERALLWTEGAL